MVFNAKVDELDADVFARGTFLQRILSDEADRSESCKLNGQGCGSPAFVLDPDAKCVSGKCDAEDAVCEAIFNLTSDGNNGNPSGAFPLHRCEGGCDSDCGCEVRNSIMCLCFCSLCGSRSTFCSQRDLSIIPHLHVLRGILSATKVKGQRKFLAVEEFVCMVMIIALSAHLIIILLTREILIC